jgi:glycine betaine/proline transport system ATP-binding protein
MRPAGAQRSSASGNVTVPARATIAETASLFGPGIEALTVIDAEGNTVGMLDRGDVVDLMMRG